MCWQVHTLLRITNGIVFPSPQFSMKLWREGGGSWVFWGSMVGNKHRDLKNSMSQLSLCPKTHSLPYFKSALRLFWIITEDQMMCNPWQRIVSRSLVLAWFLQLGFLPYQCWAYQGCLLYWICACFHPRMMEWLSSWDWTWSLGLSLACNSRQKSSSRIRLQV